MEYTEELVNPYYTKKVYKPTIKDMMGKIFTKVRTDSLKEQLIFENDTEIFTFYHDQNCCERVIIEDIIGDLKDLNNSPILIAEECSNFKEPNRRKTQDYDSHTWTFYKFATIKGYVDVRWLGTSNGYYSEKVDLTYKKNKT